MSELQHDLYIFHSCSFTIPFSMTWKRMEIRCENLMRWKCVLPENLSIADCIRACWNVNLLEEFSRLQIQSSIPVSNTSHSGIMTSLIWEKIFLSRFSLWFFTCEPLRTISDAFYLIIKTKRTNTLWSDIDINISRYTLMMMLMMIVRTFTMHSIIQIMINLNQFL